MKIVPTRQIPIKFAWSDQIIACIDNGLDADRDPSRLLVVSPPESSA